MEVTHPSASRFSLVWNAGVASADQALLSALSFAVSIILIKSIPKSEYGYYSIAVAISLFLVSVQNAVVNTPLATLLVTKKGIDKRQYVASLCYGQFLVILPSVCLVLATIGVMQYWGFDTTKIVIAAALTSAVAGLLFREFLRSYQFAEEMPGNVLKMDVLYVAIFLGLLGTTYLIWKISVALVFIEMGVSALLVALVFSRNRGWEFRREGIRKGYGENWEYGKWALMGVCVTHTQNYSYLYLLGAMLGSLAVAEVSAARLLLMPMMLVQAGWSKIAIPHGARLREEGQIRRFFKEQVLTSMLYLLCVVLYTGLLLTFSGVLQQFLLSDKYANSFHFIAAWGTIFAVGFLAVNASYGLQVMMKFDILTKVSFLVMLVTVGSSVFFIRAYGIAGGLAALILGETLLAIVLWFCFGWSVFSKGRNQETVRAQ